MIKHFCDRCGCEIEMIKENNIMFIYKDLKKELCDSCVNKLESFIYRHRELQEEDKKYEH